MSTSAVPSAWFTTPRLALPTAPPLVLISDVLIAVLVLVLPFVMGGREAWGHRVLITTSLALGCVWCLHRVRTGGRFLLTALEPLLIAGLVLVWFQATPVGAEALAKLSDEYGRLTNNWSATQAAKSSAPVWSTISFIPSETRHGFWMLAAYGIIGIVIAQRLESESDCHRLLKLIGLSGVLMAAFAVVQLVTSNDLFFWFYRQPYTGTREILKGAFTNRNHFAQFLALSIGPLLWWMLVGRERDAKSVVLHRKGLGPAQGNHSRFDNLVDPKLLILLCAAGGVLVCVMLSLSRGGMVAAGLACAVCLSGLWRSGKVRASLALVMVALGVSAIGGLIVFGQERVEERVGQLASGNADKLDQMNARRLIWKADLAAIKAFPIMGTGVGSHRYVYPIYMEELADFQGVSFTHAESSYIHLAMETGFAGLGLLIAGLLFVLARLGRHLLRPLDANRTAALAAIVAGVVGGIVHAAADFIWYAPAIVVITMLLIVAGMRLATGFEETRGVFMPRIGWLAASAGCLLLLCSSQPELAARVTAEQNWYAYLNMQFDEEHTTAERLADVRDAENLESQNIADDDSTTGDNPFSLVSQSEVVEEEVVDHSTDSTASYANDLQETRSSPDDERIRSLNARLRLLMSSLKAQQDQPQVAMHLAGRSLDLFQLLQKNGDNPLDLANIRDTVLASKFESSKAMLDWLNRAFGRPVRLVQLADQSARQALAACPIQHDAFELLMSTGFISDPQDQQRDAMLEQAVTLGRYSPTVRYSAGLALLADGRQSEAIEQWSAVFHSTPRIRATFCRRIGRATSVEVILQQFDPNAVELTEVLTEYARFRRAADVEKILYVIAEKTRTPRDAKTPMSTDELQGRQESEEIDNEAVSSVEAESDDRSRHVPLLSSAAKIAWEYGLHDQSEDLLRIAIGCDQSAYWPRHALATQLFARQRYREAEELFAWCQDAEPGNSRLDDLRSECRRLASAAENKSRPASFRR